MENWSRGLGRSSLEVLLKKQPGGGLQTITAKSREEVGKRTFVADDRVLIISVVTNSLTIEEGLSSGTI